MRYSAGERALAGLMLAGALVLGYIALDIVLDGKLAGGDDEEMHD